MPIHGDAPRLAPLAAACLLAGLVLLGTPRPATADEAGEAVARRMLEAVLSRTELTLGMRLSVAEADAEEPPETLRVVLHARGPRHAPRDLSLRLEARLPLGEGAEEPAGLPVDLALEEGRLFVRVEDRPLTGEPLPLALVVDLRRQLDRHHRPGKPAPEPARLAELYVLRSRKHGARFTATPLGLRIGYQGRRHLGLAVDLELGHDHLPRRLVANRRGGRTLQVDFEGFQPLLEDPGPPEHRWRYRPADLAGLMRLGAVLAFPGTTAAVAGRTWKGRRLAAEELPPSPFADPEAMAARPTPAPVSGDPVRDLVGWLTPLAEEARARRARQGKAGERGR